jgi:hypothetical protein
MDLVQRLVTDKSQGDQIDESSEAIDASSDNEEAEGIYSLIGIILFIIQPLLADGDGETNGRNRSKSMSDGGTAAAVLSRSCTGSGGGSLKKKGQVKVMFSERASSIPEENVADNAVSESEAETSTPSDPAKSSELNACE